MKLSSVDYYLDWPVSIKLKNLRKFIIVNLEKKGDLIRWSIVDIEFRHILNRLAKRMNLLQLLKFLV